MTQLPHGDLLELTAALVDVASPSFEEAALVALLHDELAAIDGLVVERVGDNLVARTELGRDRRLLLAGHTDTVPANGNARARVEGDRLHGVGSSDMKGGLAVMVALAREVRDPVVDLTFVFYAREEVAAVHSGLGELAEQRPDLLVADVALLGEPTDAALEAGCQGSLRLRVVLGGARAHPARPWMGRNAIHRLGALVSDLASYEPRRPVIDGLEFREALQVLGVQGGVSGNVVPDRVELVVNHRFAPDRTPGEAEAAVRAILAPHLEDGDEVVLEDMAPAAAPSLTDPLIAGLIEAAGLEVRAKLGWTDVARLAALGIPAANFGPGDATIAHTAGEHLDRAPLEAVHRALQALVTGRAVGERS
jgi:succinyl-diaminopimelate desuccinylase